MKSAQICAGGQRGGSLAWNHHILRVMPKPLSQSLPLNGIEYPSTSALYIFDHKKTKCLKMTMSLL